MWSIKFVPVAEKGEDFYQKMQRGFAMSSGRWIIVCETTATVGAILRRSPHSALGSSIHSLWWKFPSCHGTVRLAGGHGEISSQHSARRMGSSMSGSTG